MRRRGLKNLFAVFCSGVSPAGRKLTAQVYGCTAFYTLLWLFCRVVPTVSRAAQATSGRVADVGAACSSSLSSSSGFCFSFSAWRRGVIWQDPGLRSCGPERSLALLDVPFNGELCYGRGTTYLDLGERHFRRRRTERIALHYGVCFLPRDLCLSAPLFMDCAVRV